MYRKLLIYSTGCVKLLEILQNCCVALGFYLAYVHYFANEYTAALHILIILLVIPLTGLTGLASILFSDMAAKSKNWDVGSPYQIQSGLNNIAVAITAFIVIYFKWNIYAELAVLFVALIFFSLSSINHVISFFKQKNKKIIHLMRLVFSLLMIVAATPIIAKIL